MLALLLPGLGHLYVGRVVAGLAIMFGMPLAFVILVVVLVGAAIVGGHSAGGEQGAMAGAGGAYLLLMGLGFSCSIWQIYDAYVSAERTNRPAPALRRRSRR